MSTAHFLLGDTREVVATIPDGSIDLVTCSPPFLALRSYLPADHPDKGKEIGYEPDPATFITVLLELTAEWRRVLAPHGSIAIELGDSYSGSGGAGGDYAEGGWRDGQQRFDGSASKAFGMGGAPRPPRVGRDRARAATVQSQGCGPGWPLAKSLALIPELYRVALAYGIHPLTGEPSPAGRWRVRNVVDWVRPNPTVGALGDKFRPATSDIVIACVASDRWFDGDAVRVPSSGYERAPSVRREVPGKRPNMSADTVNPLGRPLYDWWEIPPGGYPGSHYAVWPKALVKPLVDSMCPREVCTLCGTPRRRIVDAKRCAEPDDATRAKKGGPLAHSQDRAPEKGWEYDRTTVGWSVCPCPAPIYRPGIVLDPFGGSGTTGEVASGMGRTSILVDIDERNLDLARDRVGMFLTTDHPFAPAPSPHGAGVAQGGGGTPAPAALLGTPDREER